MKQITVFEELIRRAWIYNGQFVSFCRNSAELFCAPISTSPSTIVREFPTIFRIHSNSSILLRFASLLSRKAFYLDHAQGSRVGTNHGSMMFNDETKETMENSCKTVRFLWFLGVVLRMIPSRSIQSVTLSTSGNCYDGQSKKRVEGQNEDERR